MKQARSAVQPFRATTPPNLLREEETIVRDRTWRVSLPAAKYGNEKQRYGVSGAVARRWASPSSLSLRSSYAGHASPFGPGVAAPRVARRAKRGGPGRTRTCNQTVMSDRISTGFVEFTAFSLECDLAHCVFMRSFPGAKLVRSASRLSSVRLRRPPRARAAGKRQTGWSCRS